MPAIVDNYKINNEKLDKRVKLLASDKIEIVDLYLYGAYSQRELARLYGVSHRLIVFTIYPERRDANYATRVARGGSKQYYSTEANTIATKSHRDYKRQLLKKGEI